MPAEIDISIYEDDKDVFEFGFQLGKAISQKDKIPLFELAIGPRKGIVLVGGVTVGLVSGLVAKDES